MGRPYQRDLLAWLRADVDPDAPLESVPQLLAGLTEMALGVSLARAIDGLEEGRWVADDTIGYSRTSSGNEIDFSPVRVPTEEGSGLTIPIESKWVDDGWRREALVLEGRYGRDGHQVDPRSGASKLGDSCTAGGLPAGLTMPGRPPLATAGMRRPT